MPNEKKRSSERKHLLVFMTLLCSLCALILTFVTQSLATPKKRAKELYQSKQLLLAAHILSYDGYFLLPTAQGEWAPARYDATRSLLVPDSSPPRARAREILELFEQRILARLTDQTGRLYTFSELGINLSDYIEKNKTLGYARLRYKLIYLILPNLPPSKQSVTTAPYGYVIPVNGYGLWDAIYGYLGLAANGDSVIGMTWYSQKETPGLGAEISLPDWQKQFWGKEIFRKIGTKELLISRAPLGIKVMRGTVEGARLSREEAKSAVDGIAGATFTMMGVTEALKESLRPYRPFLVRTYQKEEP